jgi:hypothetical protein
VDAFCAEENMETKDAKKIVDELLKTYLYKRFTIDGRLVGDLGEVIVKQNYDIELFEKVVAKYDGKDAFGRNVQIKATFHDTLGFPCKYKDVPDFYIGIKIFNDGAFEEIYNGPGKYIWELIRDRKYTKNSLHAISVNTLDKINTALNRIDRISSR